MPATGGKRAFGGAGLNTAPDPLRNFDGTPPTGTPDPEPTLRTSASEQPNWGDLKLSGSQSAFRESEHSAPPGSIWSSQAQA